ncbi:hypothetical protein AB0H69_47845, partial [Streptomyces phaeochromogenes]
EDDPARGAAVNGDVEEDVGRHRGILSRCRVLLWSRPGSPASCRPPSTPWLPDKERNAVERCISRLKQ